MTKRRTAAALLLVALSLGARGARAGAQDGASFNPGRVPAEGARAQDFVPAGWKIDARAEGDLDGDGRPDHALQLVPEGHDSSGVGPAPEAHALLVLLSADGGRLRRAGLATGLLVPVVPQYGLELSVRKGVLVVNQNFGMTEVSDLTHRFRRDPATGRFLLIGRDAWNYHRPQGPDWPTTRVSENYLTGVRLTTTDRRLRDGTNKPVTKSARIGRARVFMEEVDEDPDN